MARGYAAAAVVGKAAQASFLLMEAAVPLTMLETPGTTQEEAAARARISQASVSYLVGRKRAETLTGAAGSPRGKPGRRRIVTPRKHLMVRRAFAKDPAAHVTEIGVELSKQGVVVSDSTLRRTKKRVLGDEKPITKRTFSNYEYESPALIGWHLAWKEAIDRAIKRKRLKYSQLCYLDQTPLRIGCGAKVGYSDRPLHGGYALKGGRFAYSLWAVISNKKCLRAWLTKKGGGSQTAHELTLPHSSTWMDP